MTRYAVVNQSTLVSDLDGLAMWSATKDQLFYHVAPAWERKFIDSVYVSKGGKVPADCFPIYLLDNPDVADALGYHTEDPGGKVYGRVFAEPVLQNHGTALVGSLSISAVLSHEVIEFFIDQHCDLWADRGDGTLVAYEAGDPVENDSYVVHPVVNGVRHAVSVSNFVLDAWFDHNAAAHSKFDWMSNVTAPFQMTKGGYCVILNSATGQTSQIFGSRPGEMLHNAIKPSHPAARSARRVVNAAKVMT